MNKLAAALAALLLFGCAGLRPASDAGASYSNPVLAEDFPDPAVLRAPDGYYYAYATQTTGADGRTLNIQVARSRDLVAWTHLGDALPAKPAWASRTQDFWAPHVAQHGGRYFMYYSAKPDAALTDESRGLCLAVATAARPEGPFTDSGRPLQCGPGFVNIDPMAFDDPRTGRRLLYWGSGFQPIRVQELAEDRISFAPGSRPVDLVGVDATDSPANYRRLVEGAWVLWRAPYYYMFFSGDNCCGPGIHYAALIARSRSATGPFEVRSRRRGVVLERTGRWIGPGHNSVIRDAAGTDWIVYHAVDSRLPRTRPQDEINTRRVMLIDRIAWSDGWPSIAGPSETSQPPPRAPR
ncbi:MAG: arabinan endo,5-alpha-L-arabinosidase [Sphingomonadales bacterium]|nr:arabinan endo,5-alpha-L-arabinosidase [Sphingomonadales bacterium]